MKRNRVKLLLLVAIIFASIGAMAQAKVTWDFSAKKLPNGNYELHMKAVVPNGYHLYSQTTGEGPVPTTFTFNINPLVTRVGKVVEKGKMETINDQIWKTKQKYFGGTVDFVQIVKPKSKVKTKITGKVEYMICNDTQCLPPTEVNFAIPL
jgi:hypothetical protein